MATLTETLADIRTRATHAVAQAHKHLGDVIAAEREIRRLAATRERAERLLADPRDNWYDDEPINDGSAYHVLLTKVMDNGTGREIAVCQLREPGSTRMDEVRYHENFSNHPGKIEAWKRALVRMMSELDMRIEQQLTIIDR